MKTIQTMVLTLVLLASSSLSFAAHPNWIFPFMRGLSIGFEGLATNTQGDEPVDDYWKHHIRVRYNMGVAMARQLNEQLPTISDPLLRLELQAISQGLVQSPHDVLTNPFSNEYEVWVALADQQQSVFESLQSRVNYLLNRFEPDPNHIEYPFLLGLSVAFEGLVHATEIDYGTAELWSHHFDLRMNVAYALADALEHALSDLPTEHQGFAFELMSLVQMIREFPNHVRSGNSEYWAQEAAQQQQLFIAVRDRLVGFINYAHEQACAFGLLPAKGMRN